VAVIAFSDMHELCRTLEVTSDPPITSRDYDALRARLSDSGASLALPELHGGVSGALCAGGPAAAERWVDGFFTDHDAASSTTGLATVRELVGATWQALVGGELAFEPLLPDEDEPLEDQVQALALWCHGFMSGLGASAPDLMIRPPRAGRKRPAAPSGPEAGADGSADVAEILADFAEISRAGLDEEDDADRDTADFALAELKEYARVSTQIVFDSLAQRRAAAARDAH
jgi:uncharacterized protein YgfB (UPF0149 family)